MIPHFNLASTFFVALIELISLLQFIALFVFLRSYFFLSAVAKGLHKWNKLFCVISEEAVWLGDQAGEMVAGER